MKKLTETQLAKIKTLAQKDPMLQAMPDYQQDLMLSFVKGGLEHLEEYLDSLVTIHSFFLFKLEYLKYQRDHGIVDMIIQYLRQLEVPEGSDLANGNDELDDVTGTMSQDSDEENDGLEEFAGSITELLDKAALTYAAIAREFEKHGIDDLQLFSEPRFNFPKKALQLLAEGKLTFRKLLFMSPWLVLVTVESIGGTIEYYPTMKEHKSC